MKKDITKKLSVFFFLSSLAGIVISAMQIFEDVKSTAGTLFVYFPQEWGVFPASTEVGSMILGFFVSVIQIVAIAVAFSTLFSTAWRIGAGLLATLSIPFDAWTDIVYRSGYLTGSIAVSSVTTVAFYTFGSEALQAFSWLLLISTWRQAIADVSWTIASTYKNMKTVVPEFQRFMAAAERQAQRDLDIRIKNTIPSIPAVQEKEVESAPQISKPQIISHQKDSVDTPSRHELPKDRPNYRDPKRGESARRY